MDVPAELLQKIICQYLTGCVWFFGGREFFVKLLKVSWHHTVLWICQINKPLFFVIQFTSLLMECDTIPTWTCTSLLLIAETVSSSYREFLCSLLSFLSVFVLLLHQLNVNMLHHVWKQCSIFVNWSTCACDDAQPWSHVLKHDSWPTSTTVLVLSSWTSYWCLSESVITIYVSVHVHMLPLQRNQKCYITKSVTEHVC